MDPQAVIRDLLEEKRRLDSVISFLESLESGAALPSGPVSKRRGRRSMSSEERRIVSERMKNYWAKRRRAARDKKVASSRSGTS